MGEGAEGEGVPLPPLGVLVTRATVGVAEKEGELGVPVALPVPPPKARLGEGLAEADLVPTLSAPAEAETVRVA